MKTKKLTELKPEDEAVITKVGCQGVLRRRIFELGVVPGTKIRMIRKAPLGDPLEFEVRGYNLSLRKEDARCILVKTEIGKELMPLSLLSKEERAKVEIIEIDKDEGRDELMKKGLQMGANVSVVLNHPESKIIQVGNKRLTVPKSVCAKIFVRLLK